MYRSEIAGRASNLPIGVVDGMTRDERRKMLESFGRAPALLSAVLRQLPKKMWLYKPAPERWSIHEIILHLADSEASSYVRCRHLIAEPGVEVAEFDPARWAGNLGYFHQSTREALEIIRRLRKMTYQLLAAVPDPVWSHTVEYPKEGPISLASWIERQERHIPHHMEQMRRNYAEWIGTHPPRKPATRANGSGTPRHPVSLSAEYC
jgi:DinB family protein